MKNLDTFKAFEGKTFIISILKCNESQWNSWENQHKNNKTEVYQGEDFLYDGTFYVFFPDKKEILPEAELLQDKYLNYPGFMALNQ